MKATLQNRRNKTIYGGTGEIEDQAGARRRAAIPHDGGFAEPRGPAQNPENPAERISILASGDREKILRYYTELYYNRIEMGLKQACGNAGNACE